MSSSDHGLQTNDFVLLQPAASAEPELSRIWPELASGRARVVTSGATPSHYFLQLAAARRQPSPRDSRDIELLERLLLGQSQKALALDTGYAPSTIATSVGGALTAMGFGGGSSHVPALLVLLLHASYGKVAAGAARVERYGADANEVRVASPRPELALFPTLSRGETEVICSLVEGLTYTQIARRRSTSMRTVANQIANAYKKLRVSGRLELLCYLASVSERAQSEPVAA